MTTAVRRMVVYPWIALTEPVKVAGVEVLPREVAIARAGDYAEHVAAGTSYFYDSSLDGSPFIGEEPPTLRRVEPSVVLLDDETTPERVETANLIWFASVLFANDLQFKYANATTFEHFYQNIGGDPALHARRTRRMHGYSLNGSMVQLAIDVRPQWAGTYHEPDAILLRLLEDVFASGKAEPIRECLEALLSATRDSDLERPDAEHAHFARAVERLLHRSTQTRYSRDADQRTLGAALLSGVDRTHAGQWQIMEVRDAMRDRRNAFWHPADRTNALRPFEKQEKVAPNLIAFHATMALLIASAQDIVQHPIAKHLRDYVRATEEWIGGINEDDPRSSHEASNLRAIWVDVRFRSACEQIVAQQTAGSD